MTSNYRQGKVDSIQELLSGDIKIDSSRRHEAKKNGKKRPGEYKENYAAYNRAAEIRHDKNFMKVPEWYKQKNGKKDNP